jgi:hypothetical protein
VVAGDAGHVAALQRVSFVLRQGAPAADVALGADRRCVGDDQPASGRNLNL